MLSRAGWIAGFLLAIGLGGGCATPPVVAPTYEELQAARPFKHTLAVVEFKEEGSPIQGIREVTLAKLERVLAGHFNLVEREKVQQVLGEREFSGGEDVERLHQMGKLLGADFLLFGSVTASASRPQAREYSSRDKKNRFYGKTWNEVDSSGEVSLRVVSVSDAVTRYSGLKKGSSSQERDEKTFSDENQFRTEVTLRALGQAIGQVTGRLDQLESSYSALVSSAVDRAVADFKHDLISRFPQTGEVLQLLSEKEVLVNLGSAYGIEPGDVLIVWKETGAIKDPKTGLTVVPKERKATLTVNQVTSGLTCVAKGKKKEIAAILVGDKVHTYQ